MQIVNVHRIFHGRITQLVGRSVNRAAARTATRGVVAATARGAIAGRWVVARRRAVAGRRPVAGLRARRRVVRRLRARLVRSGVAVVTIKPGFVATPMTAHLRQGLLFAKPAPVGRRIYQAMLRGEDVVYTPGFWALILLVIRHIPERMFKHLRL